MILMSQSLDTMANTTMNKKKVKKVVKKNVAKKATKKTVSQELRIVVQQPTLPTIEQMIQPMRDDKKLALTKTWINENQVINLIGNTPKEHVYTRPGKGGQKFTYVTGIYITKALNFIFGWNWDFEVIQHGKEGNQIWVHGKLTVKSADGTQTVTKSQFGRADIKYMKGSKTEMVDFGNDLKAASTDSLKKCASLLGIASDVYGKAEVKENNINTAPDIVPMDEKVPGVDGEPTAICKVCGDPITDQEYGYSKKLYGKALCREHQDEAKRRK